MEINIIPLNDSLMISLIEKYFDGLKGYIDPVACALGVVDDLKTPTGSWVNICTPNILQNSYKLLILPIEDDDSSEIKNKLFVSETGLFNINNCLKTNGSSSFCWVPVDKMSLEWGEEVKISLILNQQECSNELIDHLLSNYFHDPKFLRTNDVVPVEINKYAPECLYTSKQSAQSHFYFKVNSIKLKGNYTNEPCFVSKSESTLIQEATIYDYLPPVFSLAMSTDENVSSISKEIDQCNISNFPLDLFKPLNELTASIMPFITSDNWMGMKPVFLVKGPAGCGKFKLIHCVAMRLGFNFINIDCNDIHTLSPSQTEIKLRVALNNVKKCVPCICKLSNIQIFGKNAEGNYDERITSNFSEQLQELYETKMKYPLVIIATLENSDLPPDINRNFIETIDMGYFGQEERINLMKWLLKSKNVQCNADLSKIASISSDFLYHDFETLMFYALKYSYDELDEKNDVKTLTIDENNLLQAHKYMQTIFSDRLGSPKVPEVYWEDIGGLANLKDEIIRRIEIPMLHDFTIKSSGILLYGPPGTGKTLLAKAVATECKLHFLSVKGPELLNMYVGQSEKNVRDVFERAKVASPCIIFFDELDALAPNRGRSGDSGGVMDRVVSQLLAEMDGLDSSNSIFIIGATNRPDLIDPALLRPGRFDKLLYVGIYSDSESQMSVLKAITRKFLIENNDQDKILTEVVNKLPSNLTGADLYSVCSNAWLNAARKIIYNYEKTLQQKRSEDSVDTLDTDVVVSLDDFCEAVAELIPSVSQEELVKYEQLHKDLAPK